MVATISEIELLNMPIKTRNISTTLLVDSGSACSIFDKSLASRVVNSISQAIWFSNQLKFWTFFNGTIHIEGKIRSPVASNDWHIQASTFTVLADVLKPLIVPNFFTSLCNYGICSSPIPKSDTSYGKVKLPFN